MGVRVAGRAVLLLAVADQPARSETDESAEDQPYDETSGDEQQGEHRLLLGAFVVG
ncbi:hypothetical protein OS965_02255 [Streptomyces sp. H27-G5]|uniref:hypothetical protein n=1 Tax=Streptomyces sp. H27-G5 TaxID=2996698 RepID=UPI0022712E05|nr:hypothetical protein [Streptomyces sp. H27-G5]MCY0916998.1 hypothetical protein [Streptomyces sp. H27-G5]